jgi:hypothetical protein
MPAMLLANNWKPIALALLLAAAFAYRAILIHQRDTAIAQNVMLTTQAADLKSAEAACEDAVARQNVAVNAIAAASARESAAAQTREANVAAAASATAADEARRAAAIRNTPIASDCAGAIKWANAEAPELGKW